MMKVSSILILLGTMSGLFANAGDLPHPGSRSPEQAHFLFNEATQAQRDGKTALAMEDYEKILKEYPSFREKFAVYQELIRLKMDQKNYDQALKWGKEALLLHPPAGIRSAIYLFNAEAQLRSGKQLATIVTANELLKTKPDSNTADQALLLKAEALSQSGKHREALASLDSVQETQIIADTEFRIRTRICSAKKPEKKEVPLNYFHAKNLCFKEAAALSKSSPAKDASQLWCDHFKKFETELKKTDTDSFTKDKLQKELEGAKALSAPWECIK